MISESLKLGVFLKYLYFKNKALYYCLCMKGLACEISGGLLICLPR
jgi:hypothetical protein